VSQLLQCVHRDTISRRVPKCFCKLSGVAKLVDLETCYACEWNGKLDATPVLVPQSLRCSLRSLDPVKAAQCTCQNGGTVAIYGCAIPEKNVEGPRLCVLGATERSMLHREDDCRQCATCKDRQPTSAAEPA
jgi:hypothetical protein